jgi:hypothetical protein
MVIPLAWRLVTQGALRPLSSFCNDETDDAVEGSLERLALRIVSGIVYRSRFPAALAVRPHDGAAQEQAPVVGVSVQVVVVGSHVPPRHIGPVGSQDSPTAGRVTQVPVGVSQVA